MKKLALIAILIATGCSKEVKEPEPLIVKVASPPKTVERFIELPDALTADCKKIATPDKSPLPFAELAAYLANERDKANDECTNRMRQIRAKQGKLK